MRFHRRTALLAVTLSLASLMLAAAPLAADEPLRWKFEKGQKLDYNMVQDMTMESTGGPQGDQKMTVHQELEMTWAIEEVNADGNAVIIQSIDRIKATMTFPPPLGEVTYDSSSEEVPVGPAAMLAPMYKALAAKEFELTMTPRGKIVDVKIPDEVLAALKGAPGAAMGDMASPEGFKKMMSQGSLELPEQALQPGDKWSTTVDIKNPLGGSQILETTYQYEGTKDIDGARYAVFTPNIQMRFEGVEQLKISEQESSGEIRFHVEEGRLSSTELNQEFSMEQQGSTAKVSQQVHVEVSPADETASEERSTSEQPAGTEN